ncbi:MAG: ATP-binding cassette domain-containing protein [Candidatus Thermoplasmatota archaeon]|jgi:ABC-type multidrug transport system ATPase subunit|nr:ATP-binding cassette domain-containing protein [Candidatus Thermoplasmatota archaeon]MCL5988437.1 ATP-binding cassette domain-containing protein [Candidatus Thermoplasmatota archaeon]
MKISSSDLTVNFGNVSALNNVSFNIDTKRLAVIGQNGSGKTTLLSVMAGLLRPDAGKLLVNEYEPYLSRQRSIREIAFLFEKVKFPYTMKVYDFLKFVEKENVDLKRFEYLKSVLSISKFESLPMNSLSSGQEQLLSVLNCLMSLSKILLIDEPFTHLDLVKSSQLFNLITSLENDIVMTTHIPEEAEGVCDYYMILDRGIVKWTGDRTKLINSDIFEVYTRQEEKYDFEPIYSYGNIVLIRSSMDDLFKLLNNGSILGFRKSGVRRIYGEIMGHV